MPTTPLAVFAVSLCLLSAVAAAADLRFRVKVEAGDVRRVESPTRATLDASAEELKDLKGPVAATMTGPDGRELPAQVTLARGADNAAALSVAFVVPSLEAGASAEYDLVLTPGKPAAAIKEGFHTTDGAGFRDLFYGDRGVWRHMIGFDPARREETYKPYHHVYGFHGEGMITKGPGGKFPHHRGLYVGWNKTTPAGGQTYDFWHCPKEYQKHVEYVTGDEAMGTVIARVVSRTDWAAEDGKPIVRDTRDVTTWRVGPGTSILDFAISIEPAGDAAVKLEGDPQHAGFQFRAAEEVQQGKAKYIRPAGAKDQGNDVWADCPWAAASFAVQGHPYVVAHFNAPANPGPVVYSTRDYGRFGAFFTGEVKPGGQPLTLNYRVLVLDAEQHKDLDADTLGARFADFVTPTRVSVERKR